MPEPRMSEKKDDFVERCMSSEEAQRDFPEQDQRLAFCHSQWTRKGGKGLPRRAK